MTCEEAGCYEAAIISIRKDLFGKSDAMRHLCSHHAPRWLAISGQVNEKAIGGSDVCHTCAAHVKVITEDLEPRIRALEAELAVEKMAHSVTIADEHESRSEFQDRIRSLEARIAIWEQCWDNIKLHQPGLREDNKPLAVAASYESLRLKLEHTVDEYDEKLAAELALRQTAEAYAARNALRVIEVEEALSVSTKPYAIYDEDAKAIVKKLDDVLAGSQTETLVDLKDPHNAHHPDRLKGPGLTAPETKGDAT